jgi:hypothetical protein
MKMTLKDSAAILVVLFGLGRPTAGFAQGAPPAQSGRSTQTLQLTLDDAVRRAVANNPDLAIVRP